VESSRSFRSQPRRTLPVCAGAWTQTRQEQDVEFWINAERHRASRLVSPCSRVDLLLVCGEHLRQPTWVAHHPDAQPMTQAMVVFDARSHRRCNCIFVLTFPSLVSSASVQSPTEPPSKSLSRAFYAKLGRQSCTTRRSAHTRPNC
jgi:hypothetical protein